MAFIDIKDPVKREEIVQDYIKNIKEIQERRENDKVRGFTQSQNIARVFKPVVEATEKSASQISSEIKNLKEPSPPPPSQKLIPTNQALEYYLHNYNKSNLDQYFGINEEDGRYVMGNKEVVVDKEDNIYLDNGTVSFKGTKGLWRLIMMKKPTWFSEEEFENYKELLERTDAIDNPFRRSEGDKPRSTAKWRFFKVNGLVGVDDDDEEDDDEGKDGDGIFLPGDINGLIQQFHLLLAEYRAGNKSSTRNKIVAILDQLLRLNYLNQAEYNYACKELSC